MTAITRRSFIEGAAAAGAGVALAGGAASALADAAPGYTPGTYAAKAPGCATVTVTMTFDEGSITDAVVDASGETPYVGGAIAPMLQGQILDRQGWDVDVVSGATLTSMAVRKAAANCIAQAAEGAEASTTEWLEPIPPVEAPESWDLETEVVFVGSNLGGVLASARLSQNGVPSIILEKGTEPYGTASRTFCIISYGGNNMAYAFEGMAPRMPIPAKLMPIGTMGYDYDDPANFAEETYDDPRQIGYFGTPYKDQDVIDFYMERTRYTIDAELLRHNVISTREYIDWLLEIGAPLGPLGGWWITWVNEDETALNHGGATITGNIMREVLEGNGSELMLNTEVTALVMEDGRCVGVQAQTQDLQTIYVKANQAVVLSADNFQSNPHMLKKYCGLGGNCKVGLTPGNGGVIRMAQGVGADMAGLGCFGGTTFSLAVAPTTGDMLPRTGYYRYVNAVGRYPWLRIDPKGGRIGLGNARDILRAGGRVDDTLDVYHRLSAQELQHGGDCIVVFDGNFKQSMEVMNASDLSGGIGMRGLSVMQGSYKLNPEVNPFAWVGEEPEQDWVNAQEEGLVRKADTLEELAELLGMDSQALAQAVEKWNALCDAGEDDPLYNYEPEWMIPIAEPPFYGIHVSPAQYSTWCGVKVDPKNQVVNTDGEVIPGLYATFNVAGGMAGEGNPLCGVGDQIGSIMSSGWTIAKALLGEEFVQI